MPGRGKVYPGLNAMPIIGKQILKSVIFSVWTKYRGSAASRLSTYVRKNFEHTSSTG